MILMKYRKWFYLFSSLIILPSLISLAFWGLKPSIDFTGGTKIELEGTRDKKIIEEVAKSSGLGNFNIIELNERLVVRTGAVNQEMHNKFKDELSKKEGLKEVSFETIGPTTSREVTIKAFVSVLLATLLIIFYIGYSFRKVPKPTNSFEFGITAILALVHDVLIVIGVFSLLGHFFGIEVDPLFITAILTVIGFSMHDTIVFFDRIRENLIHTRGVDFEETVNRSVLEVLPRTLNTSFMVIGTLLILLIFGGETIRFFTLALVIGMVTGTYSSTFTAAPLLIDWQEYKARNNKS